MSTESDARDECLRIVRLLREVVEEDIALTQVPSTNSMESIDTLRGELDYAVYRWWTIKK